MRTSVLLLLVLVTGCAQSSGDGADDATGDGDAAGGISRVENDLVVLVDRGNGSEPVTWTLTCAGTAEGTHPDADAACAHLAGLDDPFAPIPDDVACTEQYGGPQSAHVAGLWGNEPVDLEVTRVDGCRISQWDSLVPLLPSGA
ncbi:SSI family serine proteinase inhibitor [Blastococcus sp. CT_GayMR16]|uniref:SSI family serine proteinase inhibitor n=1 Tax=Blastococcus sp. CT_GayMR16 TaxID=2559607 RepID=UPI001ADD7669|nr:SSI family serine proteinase inhibitor [Blastococcus sp. CT_GayMR16]